MSEYEREVLMKLSEAQLEQYEEQGFLLLHAYFSSSEIEFVRSEVPALLSKESKARVFEENRRAVRAIHGCHLESEVMRRLTMHPKMLAPVGQIIKSEVYVYQFKINVKAAFDGESWPWHQDFKHWQEEDGLRSPQILSAAVYLDDINEFNGPIYIIPGSHKEAVLETEELEMSGWKKKYRADLRYSVSRETVTKLIEKRGMISTKAPPGSVLFFHSNLVHGSASNITPRNRWLVIVTYNSVNNVPASTREPRDEFLVGRDHAPLQPLAWESDSK